MLSTETESPPDDGSVNMGILAEVPAVQYRHGGFRYTLIMQGMCERCAHCGLALTDSLSISLGMGPVCRDKGGFNDEPEASDEIQALIDLAQYPELVKFLEANFKPKGKKEMMNAMVRIASLNRKSPVHQALCDSIESLGWRALASKLRESLAVVEIGPPAGSDPNQFVKVWVKKSEWSWAWTNALRSIPGAFPSRQEKGTIVPLSQKRALWELIKKYYNGCCCKTPKGTVRIPKPENDAASAP